MENMPNIQSKQIRRIGTYNSSFMRMMLICLPWRFIRTNGNTNTFIWIANKIINFIIFFSVVTGNGYDGSSSAVGPCQWKKKKMTKKLWESFLVWIDALVRSSPCLFFACFISKTNEWDGESYYYFMNWRPNKWFSYTKLINHHRRRRRHLL